MAQNRIDFEGQGVELKKQAELAWCYAAVISIVSRLLGGAQGWDPCQIVSANLVEKLYLGDAPDQTKDDACNCCQKNEPKVCSGEFAVGGIGETLTRLNIDFHRGQGCPSSDVIQNEIDFGVPVLLALTRGSGPGHVAMVIGYDDTDRPDDPDRTDMLTLYDPAAINLPGYNQRVDPHTMTLDVTLAELYSRYPTPKYQVRRHYIQLAVGVGGIPLPPVWTAFH